MEMNSLIIPLLLILYSTVMEKKRKYKPHPVRRVEIPKPDGGVRKLGVLIYEMIT